MLTPTKTTEQLHEYCPRHRRRLRKMMTMAGQRRKHQRSWQSERCAAEAAAAQHPHQNQSGRCQGATNES